MSKSIVLKCHVVCNRRKVFVGESVATLQALFCVDAIGRMKRQQPTRIIPAMLQISLDDKQNLKGPRRVMGHDAM